MRASLTALCCLALLTAGTVSAQESHEPTGRVATSTDVGDDGLIGKGVQPDIPAPRTVQDLLAGRDAALEAAIAELRSSPVR